MCRLEEKLDRMKNLHMLNSKAVAEIIKPLTKAYYSTRTRNVVLGGSTILYLDYWTDKLPHDLDIVVFKPSMMQIGYLEQLRAMNADINYASDYDTEGMDHYVVKVKVGENTIDFIVYPNTDKPEGLKLISFADDELTLYKQSCDNIIVAKLISAREKDYLQLSAIFKYMAEKPCIEL